MNWLGRTLVRAAIWQGVREAGYAARRAGRKQQQPTPSREVLVTMACREGHRFTLRYATPDAAKEALGEEGRASCPQCRAPATWTAVDEPVLHFHADNHD